MEQNNWADGRAVTTALFLTFVASVLTLLIVTIPSSFFLAVDGLRDGMALWAYQSVTFGQSITLMAVLPFLFLAALPPTAGKTARLAAGVASGAALLMIGWIMWATSGALFMSSFENTLLLGMIKVLDVLSLLALALALTLRMASRTGRAIGLAVVVILAGLFALHGAGLGRFYPNAVAILLISVLAGYLWRRKRLPGQSLPWLIFLLVYWVLPWIAFHLPYLVEALAIMAPTQRLHAVLEAVLGNVPLRHLAHPAAGILILGVLAGLHHQGASRRRDWWIAGGLFLVMLIPTLAEALNIFASSPFRALEAVRNGIFNPGVALIAVLAWAVGFLIAPMMVVASAWLFVTWNRPFLPPMQSETVT